MMKLLVQATREADSHVFRHTERAWSEANNNEAIIQEDRLF